MLRFAWSSAAWVALSLVSACVPKGNGTPDDAGAEPSSPATPTFAPSVGVMTSVFTDDFERTARPADGSAPRAAAAVRADASARGDAHVEGDGGAPAIGDDGGADDEPSALGPDWLTSKKSAWRIEKGKLCGTGARNHGVWLQRTLPVNARIEFDAMTEDTDGDLKAELWGDGRSYATGASYTNATSYLTIYGGWKNTIHALARLNEHGKDRKEVAVDKDSDDPRQHPVSAHQSYRFKIERTDGHTIRWWVNDTEMFTFDDPQPLAGAGHDHFGFNDWDVKVCFDNVKVTPL